MLRLVLIISLIINGVFAFLFLKPKSILPTTYQVERIIDGDTFVLTNKQ